MNPCPLVHQQCTIRDPRYLLHSHIHAFLSITTQFRDPHISHCLFWFKYQVQSKNFFLYLVILLVSLDSVKLQDGMNKL